LRGMENPLVRKVSLAHENPDLKAPVLRYARRANQPPVIGGKHG
jgi:hypothetical protein